MDVFVRSIGTKVPDAFYSKVDCLAMRGLDALLHPWSGQVTQGSKFLMFLNGPFHLIGQLCQEDQ